jgi:hypothetical protein
MTRQIDGNTNETVMELLIENGFDGFANVIRIRFNEAMNIERDHPPGTETPTSGSSPRRRSHHSLSLNS